MNLFLVLMLIPSISLAQVSPIKKGESAPQDGFFITKEQEKKFRQMNEDKKKVEHQNLSLKDLQIKQEEKSQILQERLDNRKKQAEDLKEQVEDLRTDTFFGRTVYFIGGLLTAGAVGYITLKYGRR